MIAVAEAVENKKVYIRSKLPMMPLVVVRLAEQAHFCRRREEFVTLQKSQLRVERA